MIRTLCLVGMLLGTNPPADIDNQALRKAPSRSPLVLRLSFEAGPRKIIYLRDVVTLVDDPQGVWPVLSSLIIGTARDAAPHGVTRGLVVRRLECSGMPRGRVLLWGPSVCELAPVSGRAASSALSKGVRR